MTLLCGGCKASSTGGTQAGYRRFRKLVTRLYGWVCERLYHELAWGYEGVAALVSFGRWGRWRRMALEAADGSRILELGFGTGALLAEGSRAHQMVGVDPSWEMQQVAGRRLAAQGRHALRILGRAEALPLADESVDTVIATFPAGYILETSTLQESARVLRRGGRLVIGGLWVGVDLGGWERWIPVFYGAPSHEMQAAWAARLRAQGYTVEMVERRDGVFRVGIAIATTNAEQRDARTAKL